MSVLLKLSSVACMACPVAASKKSMGADWLAKASASCGVYTQGMSFQAVGYRFFAASSSSGSSYPGE